MFQTGPDEWSACPPGELRRLAGRLRSRKHRRALLRAGAVTSAAMVLVAAVAFYVGRPGAPLHGGISCFDVIRAAEAYRNDQLDAEMRAKVLTHLGECANCRQRYKEMGVIIQVPVDRVAHRVLAMLDRAFHGLNRCPIPTLSNVN